MGRMTLLVFALIMSCMATAAEAARPRVLLMSEADDAGDVPARVLETIADALKVAGFDTFDARNTTTSNDSDPLVIARTAQRQPMDALVLVAVYTETRKLSYTTNIHVRVTGRIVDVKTGARIGGFEVNSPQGWRAPVNCEGSCLLETIGKNAKLLAVDVGAELAHKLKASLPAASPTLAQTSPESTPGYMLIFSGFSNDDLTGAEEYLVAFKGYKSFRKIAGGAGESRYAYEFGRDSGSLTQDLHMMLDRLGAAGRITFVRDAKTFSIVKTPAQTASDNRP